MRWIKKLEKLNADPVDRNHVGLKQGVAVLTEHIVHICTWLGGTHLDRPHQQRKTKHFLVPTDGTFDVGYADPNVVYGPRIS